MCYTIKKIIDYVEHFVFCAVYNTLDLLKPYQSTLI